MEYFLLKPHNGEQTGTYSIEQVRAMLSEGVIGPDTCYWHEGITEWRPVDQIEESLHFQPPVTTSPQGAPTHPPKFAPTSRAVLRHDPVLERANFPPVEAKKPGEFVPSIITLPPIRLEPASAPDSPHVTAPAPSQPAAAARPRNKPVLGWLIYILNVIVVALAIDYAGPAVHYLSQLHPNSVTLTSNDTYALVDQAAIKSFADDLRNSPTVDSLQRQVAQTTDPVTLVSLKIGLEKENARHIDEVEQSYLGMGKAEIIEPGTYRLINYLDEKGDPTTLNKGNPVWIAILYKDQTVYAYQRAPGK